MATPAKQTKRWTRLEYDRMAEAGLFSPGERVELLEGEIIAVTPEQSPHSACIGLIDRALRQAFDPSYWIRIQWMVFHKGIRPICSFDPFTHS